MSEATPDAAKRAVLITGGTGFIGTPLVAKLAERYTVWVLSRYPQDYATQNTLDSVSYIDNLDALSDHPINIIINLAGEPVNGARWNAAHKQKLTASRVDMTAQLVAWANQRKNPPDTIISGSAIGYYGLRDDSVLDETSAGTPCFTHDLCRAWETEALNFSANGARLCLLRIGVVLDQGGGAFTDMRQPFDKKVGVCLGNGEQWLSWIHRDDLVRAIIFLIENEDCQGIYNGTAPTPVTQQHFAATLADLTDSWMLIKAPGILLKLALGAMAQELILSGQRVVPKKLVEAGFSFKYRTLRDALADVLKTS